MIPYVLKVPKEYKKDATLIKKKYLKNHHVYYKFKTEYKIIFYIEFHYYKQRHEFKREIKENFPFLFE